MNPSLIRLIMSTGLVAMPWLWMASIVAPCSLAQTPDDEALYFPSGTESWQHVDPTSIGWDREKLDDALRWAGEVGSSGVVILHRGKILAQRHWDRQPDFRLANGNVNRYFFLVVGKNDAGHVIEDVASVQKSVTSILVGIAQEKGLLNIDDRVFKHLGRGWSKATQEQEDEITLRHLITMTSGLTDKLEFAARAGSRWKYNTSAYAKARDCVVAASSLDANEVTRRWLTEPIGMKDSKWVQRPAGDQSVNPYGFATTANDLARFGLMMQAGGQWGDATIIGDRAYLRSATEPSQRRNKSYGYLWWLNGEKRIGSAPADTYSAKGALTRRLYVLPSMDLVITRLGDVPKMKNPKEFDTEFCRRILAARGDR